MSIRKKGKGMPTIDLDGPDGNAFVLMGLAQGLARRAGIPTRPILEKMRSGDYINLLKVFEEHFGGSVVMVTNNKEYLKALGK